MSVSWLNEDGMLPVSEFWFICLCDVRPRLLRRAAVYMGGRSTHRNRSMVQSPSADGIVPVSDRLIKLIATHVQDDVS